MLWINKDFFKTKESSEKLTEEEKKEWRRIKLNVEKVRENPDKIIYEEVQ